MPYSSYNRADNGRRSFYAPEQMERTVLNRLPKGRRRGKKKEAGEKESSARYNAAVLFIKLSSLPPPAIPPLYIHR